MPSLLNTARPPVFCPGCSHEKVIGALDKALQILEISGNQVVIVSDIGCSGLFDVFFHTHAFHGLHGRALTYALGLKMANPELHVIVTMGDGGMGIGGAHILSACRRNADITLLILNNFNFGMTGGQYSPTTPTDAQTVSRFLNTLESPLDICKIANAAGAPFIIRCSGLNEDLSNNMVRAIGYQGFALMDIWGICPGRYTRKNRLNPKLVAEKIEKMEPFTGVQPINERHEFCSAYSKTAGQLPAPQVPKQIIPHNTPPQFKKREILILGSAGQRVVTAGELLCLAGLTAGLQTTQKNDYDITVLKGPSVSEIILWPGNIGYTGIENPEIILAISAEGVNRRRALFSQMKIGSTIIHAADVNIPKSCATTISINFKKLGISSPNRALASLAVLAKENLAISFAMLADALQSRFSLQQVEKATAIITKIRDADLSVKNCCE